MDIRTIKKELTDIKENIKQQKECLEQYMENGSLQNEYFTDDILKYIEELLLGKKNVNVPQVMLQLGNTYDTKINGLNLVTNYLIKIYNLQAINYNSFEEMQSEINDIKGNVESAGIPENMIGYKMDIIDCYKNILDNYKNIIDDKWETIESIIEFMDNIINKISEIV
ncbi:MAG: hypothetical protein NC177_06450 [Ruminococcus flavefaciens]|nr:hypothetical protein [Ruminococcus flavefaciens]